MSENGRWDLTRRLKGTIYYPDQQMHNTYINNILYSIL